jgi:hypothetical protein
MRDHVKKEVALNIGRIAPARSPAPFRATNNMETFANLLWGTVLAILLLGFAGTASAVEVGEPAPEFTMPSTMGGNISLSDYRGKKWVLLEFYGADFAPT